MRVYAQKGHALSEPERLELGRLLLKAGYIAMLGKEKQGSTSRHYVEFYRKVELFGQKEAADEGCSFTDGDKKREHRRIGEIDPEADADKPKGAQSAACLSAQSEGLSTRPCAQCERDKGNKPMATITQKGGFVNARP